MPYLQFIGPAHLAGTEVEIKRFEREFREGRPWGPGKILSTTRGTMQLDPGSSQASLTFEINPGRYSVLCQDYAPVSFVLDLDHWGNTTFDLSRAITDQPGLYS